MLQAFSKRLISRVLLSLAAVVLMTSTSFAQQTNGTIAGTVIDSTGAAIIGATVIAKSLETNDTRTVKSGKEGSYRIESVSPGTYRINVSAPSFSNVEVARTVVNASVITSVNVILTAGGTSTAVEVNASEIALLNTESAELSETISPAELNNLPIQSLNPYALAFTLPGVSQVTADNFTNGVSYAGSGTRPRSNNFLIEGVDNNDQGLHGQAFQPENIEAYDQTAFLLNAFPAEYGRGGTVSNLLLKSGSNQFHGAVYERLENSSFDAADKADILNQNPKAKYRENIFGFRVGGPVIHDRLFFFVSNQWDRLRNTANLDVLTVPTAAGYATLNQFSSNPQVATLVKAYAGLVGTNPLYAQSIDLGPDPVTGVDRGLVNFAGVQRSLGGGSNGRELEATSDFIISANDKLRARFIQSPFSTPYDTGNFPAQLPGFDTDQDGTAYNAGLAETHIFSANLLNELRLAWSRIGFDFALRPETLANPLAVSHGVSISGITGYGIPTNVPQGRFQNTYQLQDAVSWTRGSHSMKFGFDIEDQRIKDAIPFNFYGSIPYTASKTSNPATNYTALGNYIDDFGGTASNAEATIQFGNPIARPEIWVQNYFAEDSWKILPTLTLEYGLRYEFNGAPLNYLPNPGFNSANPTAFPGGVPEISDKTNFAPRVGINWGAARNTVVSAGFGMFYDHIFTNIIDNIQGSSPNAASKAVFSSTSGRGTPNWSQSLRVCATCAITTTAPTAKDTSNVAAQHLLDPLTYEYNLRVQQQLPAGMVFSLGYVGSRTEHNYASTEFNPTIAGGPRLFPSRGRIIREDNTGDSNYNGLEAELQHRTHNGLTFRAAYTWSKAMDDASEIFTDSGPQISEYAEEQYPAPRGREYSRSGFDHRNIATGSLVYQPPVWHAEGAARVASAVVNDWTFGLTSYFQSGNPINVELGYDWNGDGIGNDRPQLGNPNAPMATWAVYAQDFGLTGGPNTLCDGAYFWDTNDDCHPVQATDVHWIASHFYTTGNTVSRNYLTADHMINSDVSVGRSFRTFEHQDFQFRAELFNVFNHGNTGNYNANLTTGIFAPGYGTNTFDDKDLTVSGHRNVRFYFRYEF